MPTDASRRLISSRITSPTLPSILWKSTCSSTRHSTDPFYTGLGCQEFVLVLVLVVYVCGEGRGGGGRPPGRWGEITGPYRDNVRHTRFVLHQGNLPEIVLVRQSANHTLGILLLNNRVAVVDNIEPCASLMIALVVLGREKSPGAAHMLHRAVRLLPRPTSPSRIMYSSSSNC